MKFFYGLLEYLLRNKDRVISKDELITHVWSDDDDILPNTVEVYIGYLRNKIDRPFKKNYVQTIRGFGYKIASWRSIIMRRNYCDQFLYDN